MRKYMCILLNTGRINHNPVTLVICRGMWTGSGRVERLEGRDQELGRSISLRASFGSTGTFVSMLMFHIKKSTGIVKKKKK